MSAHIVAIELGTLQRRVKAAVKVMGTELVGIRQSRGRILAETIRTATPHPLHDVSVMDGFAVRHTDIAKATPRRPVALAIVGEVAAGQTLGRRLRPGCAVRIMTGAPLPPGADCVIRVEDVRESGANVLIRQSAPKHWDVRRKGTDMRRGIIVLRRGSVIGPSEMAMLALLDRPRVTVYQRPRVGILSTGDELGPVGRPRPPGYIPDSNRYGLLGLVASAGCVPVDGGRAGDDPEVLLRHLRSLARRSDFIVTSGGVSAGDYDVVKILFREIGGVTLYRLPMKPGKPQAFGRIDGVPFFGLPGNPVSSMVVFDFLVRPALRRMAGAQRTDLVGFPARTACDFPQKSRKWEFMRVAARPRDGHWLVRPIRSQRSSNLKSMTEADGYVVLAPGLPIPQKGETVTFIPFPT
ncbi:MAG TPA: gephyrin-like molybdotransferase Glp [Acidobacteriota bacterium]|nr:gephyrin-like molybdotransferase Glp [Acidobacteriota bacterium]